MQRRRFVPIKLTEEDQIQAAIVRHWQVRGVPNTLVSAIPNGGARSFTTGARMKVTGTLAGMPDLLCMANGCAFFIELKKPKGRLSKEQKERIPQIEAAGFEVYVIDNVDDALHVLENAEILRPDAVAA